MLGLDSILLESMAREDLVELLSENYSFLDYFIEGAEIYMDRDDDDDDIYDDDEPETINEYDDDDDDDKPFDNGFMLLDTDDDDDYECCDKYDRPACGENRLYDIYNTDHAYEDYDLSDDDDDDYDIEDDDDDEITPLGYVEEGMDCGGIDSLLGDCSLAGYDYILDDAVDEYLDAIDDIETLRDMEAEDLIIGSPKEQIDPDWVCTLYPCGVDNKFDMYNEDDGYLYK